MNKIFLKFKRHLKPMMGIVVLLVMHIFLLIFRRDLLKKDIWLICEKRNEARDNGYHFYKYLKEKHPEINSYFVITKDSADLHKVESLGNVIFADTMKHALYYLAAEKSISSQPFGAFPFSFSRKELKIVNKLCNSKQKTVFLQHGIIKDELSHNFFDYHRNNIDYFVCSATKEYEFVKNYYGYPDKNIGCIGLCRFDNLYNSIKKREKIILVMPTWRFWLKRENTRAPLTDKEKELFLSSDYYQQFAKLISDSTLKTCLKENGYKLVFYMHYQMQDYSEAIKQLENENIIIADRYSYDVQDLLIRASFLVTDYSSVYFDFAYMNKPLLYFQFDKEKFEAGHYSKGYFEYERDGFGPCFDRAENVIKYLCEAIDENCEQKKYYQQRIDDFFNVRDEKNCERTFDAIYNL